MNSKDRPVAVRITMCKRHPYSSVDPYLNLHHTKTTITREQATIHVRQLGFHPHITQSTSNVQQSTYCQRFAVSSSWRFFRLAAAFCISFHVLYTSHVVAQVRNRFRPTKADAIVTPITRKPTSYPEIAVALALAINPRMLPEPMLLDSQYPRPTHVTYRAF